MDSFMKKTGTWHSLPRTSSTLSICSLPRTNSSCSLPRKGSLEDILNYSNFLDETNENSQPAPLIEPEMPCNNSNTSIPRNFSYSSFFVDSKSFSTEEDKVFEEVATAEQGMPSPTRMVLPEQQSPVQQQQTDDLPIEEATTTTIAEQDDDEEASHELHSVENLDQVRTLEEALRESTSEPRKVSYGSYGEFTVIDGVMYNSKGYEICGHLNQHNRPCQRIGKCPFHTRKEQAKSTEKKPVPTPVNIQVTSAPKHPMKKTPYKQGWTKEEHFRFLTGLEIHGKGAWKDIALIVGSRTPTQIQSHAQKYFLRQKQKVKNKRSIHDFTLEDLKKSLNQNVVLASKPSSEANSPIPSEHEEDVAPKKNKVKRTKRVKDEKKKKVKETPNTTLVEDEQNLLQQPLFLAAQQQAYNPMPTNTAFSPEFTRSLASFVSAMQNPALSSAIPMSSYTTMLGSMLVNPAFAAVAPAFLAQQQFLMQQQEVTAMPMASSDSMEEDATVMNKEGILDETDTFEAFPAYGLDTSSLVVPSPINHKRKLHETTFADDIFSPEKKKFHKL